MMLEKKRLDEDRVYKENEVSLLSMNFELKQEGILLGKKNRCTKTTRKDSSNVEGECRKVAVNRKVDEQGHEDFRTKNPHIMVEGSELRIAMKNNAVLWALTRLDLEK